MALLLVVQQPKHWSGTLLAITVSLIVAGFPVNSPPPPAVVAMSVLLVIELPSSVSVPPLPFQMPPPIAELPGPCAVPLLPPKVVSRIVSTAPKLPKPPP